LPGRGRPGTPKTPSVVTEWSQTDSGPGSGGDLTPRASTSTPPNKHGVPCEKIEGSAGRRRAGR
jgi:hypothetical protein